MDIEAPRSLHLSTSLTQGCNHVWKVEGD